MVLEAMDVKSSKRESITSAFALIFGEDKDSLASQRNAHLMCTKTASLKERYFMRL